MIDCSGIPLDCVLFGSECALGGLGGPAEFVDTAGAVREGSEAGWHQQLPGCNAIIIGQYNCLKKAWLSKASGKSFLVSLPTPLVGRFWQC